MRLEDQHVLSFTGAGAVPSLRGSVSRLAIFFLPANKTTLQQR